VAEYQSLETHEPVLRDPLKKEFKYKFLINILLFILTFFTTTAAGVAWLNLDPYDLNNFSHGLIYSILILTVLTFHEFGHFFAARIHSVKTTLPFYIPFPLVFPSFGTLGAVIRMQSPARTRKALFDIGIAGPIAGFVVTVAILIYGFTHLPSIEYLYAIHPEYRTIGVPLEGFSFGPNLIYLGLGKLLVPSNVFVPPMSEMYHYPFLCVGWFGLFITALNLIPVGQLDGGHIVYALFAEKHQIIARIFFGIIFAIGLLGLLQFFGVRTFERYGLFNWLIWSFLILFVIKIKHPPIYDSESLDLKRKLWGLFALLMFVGSFTPVPVMDM
jgi:membrane-associated protease RseP (regulator of RpoE activity)